MYEEADCKYVEAEKRIRNMEKLGYNLENESAVYDSRRQETTEYVRNRQGRDEFLEVKDKGNGEEDGQRNKILNDQR